MVFSITTISDCDIDLDGNGVNTMLGLHYCDGANYKTHRDVVLRGRLSHDQIATIVATLDDHQFFIPGQIGLPDIQHDESSAWYPDLDHPWHRFASIRYTNATPTEEISADELVNAFERVTWDGGYLPSCYDDMRDAYDEYAATEVP